MVTDDARKPLRVFISSPFFGMLEYRAATENALKGWDKIDFKVRIAESIPSGGGSAAERSLRFIEEETDVYVLLFGGWYGTVDPKYGKSYTHLEFERALALHKKGRIQKLFYFRLTNLPGPLVQDPDRLFDNDGLKAKELHLSATEICAPIPVHDTKDLSLKLAQELQRISHAEAERHAALSPAKRSEFAVPCPPQDYNKHVYSGLTDKPFVGRKRQIDELDTWASIGNNPVMIVEAFGGMGKSALTWHWYENRERACFGRFEGRLRWCFYETDAYFKRFEVHLFSYLWQQPLQVAQQLLEQDRPQLQDAILQELTHRPFFLLLDGLEREFDFYHADETALEGAPGKPSATMSASSIFSGSSGRSTRAGHAHRMWDGGGGHFLRQLASLKASRVLITTRHTPIDMMAHNELIKGISRIPLKSFEGEDEMSGVELLKGRGIKAPLPDLLGLVRDCGGHPLTLQIVAGHIAEPPFAGDLAEFLKSEPGFRPPFGDIVQSRNHVLAYALRDLNEREKLILELLQLNSNNGPVTINEMCELSSALGDLKRAEVIAALQRLHRQRAILEFNDKDRTYEMHPVVRGTVREFLKNVQRDRTVYERLEKRALGDPATDGDIAGTIGRQDELAGLHLLAQTEEGRRKLNLVVAMRLEKGDFAGAWPAAISIVYAMHAAERYAEIVQLLQEFLEPGDVAGSYRVRLPEQADRMHLLARIADALRLLGAYPNAIAIINCGLAEARESIDLLELRALCHAPLGNFHAYHADMQAALALARQLKVESETDERGRANREAHILRMLAHQLALEGRTDLGRLALARASRTQRRAPETDGTLDTGQTGFTRGARTELLEHEIGTGANPALCSAIVALQMRLANEPAWMGRRENDHVRSDYCMAWCRWNAPHGTTDPDFGREWAVVVENHRRRGELAGSAAILIERAEAYLGDGQLELARADLSDAASCLDIWGLPITTHCRHMAAEARLALADGASGRAEQRALAVIQYCDEQGIGRGWQPLETAIGILEKLGRLTTTDPLVLAIGERSIRLKRHAPWLPESINPKDEFWIDPELLPPVDWY